MQIFELSSSYTDKKLTELIKGIGNNKPFVVLTVDGKRIFVTHGSRTGNIFMQKEYEGLYDILLCCWKDTGEINYISYRKYLINNETRYFLVQYPVSEMEKARNDPNYILGFASDLVNKDVIKETKSMANKFGKIVEVLIRKGFENTSRTSVIDNKSGWTFYKYPFIVHLDFDGNAISIHTRK